MNSSIALLFGSFNPPHLGHLSIGEWVLGHGLCNEVWYVVSPQNPLKSPLELAPIEHRLRMVELTISSTRGLKMCDIELSMPTPSYTFNTISALRERYPNTDFKILCGSDILTQLDKWYRIDDLRQIVEFLTYPRGGEFSASLASAPPIDIDATRLRNAIANNHTIYSQQLITKHLHPTVIEYINQHNLYKK